jgi:hypothetical protein
MDYMFIAFNNAAASCRDEAESHFERGIECGWVKLEEYYKLTDVTPVYRAALHEDGCIEPVGRVSAPGRSGSSSSGWLST